MVTDVVGKAAVLHAEREARADVSRHQLGRHASAHSLDELCAGAVHRDDDLGLERSELGHGLLDVLVGCGDEVKSADYRMELRDARHRHRLLDGIDQPNVAAGADDDQPAALDDITSGMLVRMGILQELPAALSLGEMIVLVNHRATTHLLKGIALYVAGSESMGEIVRLVAAHGLDVLGREHQPIDCAPGDRVFGIAEEFFPKALFATVVEAQVAAHARAVLHQEAD